MLLIDPNSVAYLLIDGESTVAAHRLRRRDSDWRSEAFLTKDARLRKASPGLTQSLAEALA